MISDFYEPYTDLDDDDYDLDEMQAYVIIQYLRAENNMLFDRAARRLAELKEAQARIAELEALVAEADRIIIGINRSQMWLTMDATVDVVAWTQGADRRKAGAQEAQP